MTRLPLSAAAGGLLRAMLARAGEGRDRILLTDLQSVDWQSLTFVGERHRMRFRICAPLADALLARFTNRLDDAEFSIPGQILASIAVEGRPARNADGSITIAVEALTITE